MIKPQINVTPLIDVLLVLLIIFMVITPLKPSRFKAQIPKEPTDMSIVKDNPYTLVVTLNADSSLGLNRDRDMGTVETPDKLVERLRHVFRERTENGVMRDSLASNSELPFADRVEKTVFIKAPRSTLYGQVAKIVDAVKLSGASPISLQIDNID